MAISLNRIAQIGSIGVGGTFGGFVVGTQDDRVLVVGVQYKSNNILTDFFIEWVPGSQFMSIERRAADAANAQVEIWILNNPGSGTGNLTVDFNGTSLRATMWAKLFIGASPVFLDQLDAQGSNNAPTATVLNVVSSDFVVDAMAQVSAGPDAITSNNRTLDHDLASTGGGTDLRGASQSGTGLSGSVAMTYGLDGADDWNIIAGRFESAAVGGADVFHENKYGIEGGMKPVQAAGEGGVMITNELRDYKRSKESGLFVPRRLAA